MCLKREKNGRHSNDTKWGITTRDYICQKRTIISLIQTTRNIKSFKGLFNGYLKQAVFIAKINKTSVAACSLSMGNNY